MAPLSPLPQVWQEEEKRCPCSAEARVKVGMEWDSTWALALEARSSSEEGARARTRVARVHLNSRGWRAGGTLSNEGGWRALSAEIAEEPEADLD